MKAIVQNIFLLAVLLVPEVYAQQIDKAGASRKASETRQYSSSSNSDASVKKSIQLAEPTTLRFVSTDVAPIVQAIASLVGIFGLYLLWYQTKLTNKWNRTNTQHELLSIHPSQDLERQVGKITENLAQDNRRRLKDESSKIIYEDFDRWLCVKTFLGKLEQLCAAINSDAVDEQYAYTVHSAMVVDYYFIFEHYIDYARRQSEDLTLYSELEKVAKRWDAKTKEDNRQLIKAKQAEVEKQRVTV